VSEPFWETNLILHVLAGSRAHGLATAASDTDSRGVCIPPAKYLVGLSSFEQHEDATGDNVVYSLRKFVGLALSGNPNIIETLFTDDEAVLFANAAGRRLRDARDLFLTCTVGERFVRYAMDQLQRIQRHYRWLKNPPAAKPRQEDWDGVREGSRWRFAHTDAERGYRAALKEWQQYERWRAERNPVRAALEASHGYDTKHAMHLCRLLKMGREILVEGVVLVRRPDADWLRGVRDGALTYEELIQWAEPYVEQLGTWLEQSSLPAEPDHQAAEALVVDLQLESLAQTLRTGH
jgi:predicted nucleotidyltransferase